MKSRPRLVLGATGLMLALVFAWVVAYWSHVHGVTHPSSLDLPSLKTPAPSHETRDLSLEGPFIASEIGKSYHLPSCFYAAKQTKHRISFKTLEEAEASGRHACTNCINTSQSQRVAHLKPSP